MSPSIVDCRKIKIGDIVTLTDEQTLRDLMEAQVAGALDGLDLTVQRVRRLQHEAGLAEWILCDLGGQPEGQPPLLLLAKIVDEDLDLRVYWMPDDVEIGSRGDLIEQGVQWIFQEPQDIANFIPADLEFTELIEQDADEGPISYTIKGGAMHGQMQEFPAPAGVVQPQPATIVEFAADAPCENPEILLLEVGGLDPYGERLAEGGVITFLQGAGVSPSDMRLLAKGGS